MKHLSFILLFLPALVFLSCQQSVQSVDLAKEEAAIRKLTAAWFADESRRDMEASLSYLTPNTVIQPAGSPAFIGIDAMRSDYEKFFKVPFKEIAGLERTVFVAQSGDLAYDIGGWRVVFEGADSVTGKSTIIWRKFDSHWKCVLLSYSSNASTAGN